MKINKNYLEYLKDYETNVICFLGGGGSGKSFFVLEQRLILQLLTQINRRVLVLKKVQATSKYSTLQGVLDGLETTGLTQDLHYKYNKSEMSITLLVNFNNIQTKGNTIYFKGLDDRTKVKSFKGITDIVMEEASDFTYDDFNELKIRTRSSNNDINKQLILMLNPVDSMHWVSEVFNRYEKVTLKYPNDDLPELANQPKKWEFEDIEKVDNEEIKIKYKVFRSNFDDNKLLDNQTKAQIQALKRYDYNMYRVYRLGLEMERDELIFKDNYEVKKLNINDYNDVKIKLGLDFGFSSHPTACIKSYILDDDILYIDEELIYSTNLTNQDIYEELSNVHGLFICDSAEPKSIEELARLGLDVQGVTKGQGSVNTGIKKMKTYKIVINPSCENVIKEFGLYSYKVNKNGEITQSIIPEHDHAIDAIRYSIMEEESKFYFI